MRGWLLTALLLMAAPGGAAPNAASTGRVLIFFDTAKSEVSKDAAINLDGVVAAYRQAGAVTVQLDSYSDSYGGAADNLRLSRQRAEAVRSYLQAHGVPSSSMTLSAHGENGLLVPTADGVMEAQNRRVEITLGAGAAR